MCIPQPAPGGRRHPLSASATSSVLMQTQSTRCQRVSAPWWHFLLVGAGCHGETGKGGPQEPASEAGVGEGADSRSRENWEHPCPHKAMLKQASAWPLCGRGGPWACRPAWGAALAQKEPHPAWDGQPPGLREAKAGRCFTGKQVLQASKACSLH